LIAKPVPSTSRAIPLLLIMLLALAVHGPLLLMQLPANSYDATTHIFFAAHYASHWFSPWNEKWFGGMSQTTYPPLTHQWIALFSHLFGLTGAYMVVQLIVILLLPVGMYRYAKLWVPEREASYAALGSVFLGSLAMLVYQSGQLPTTTAAALTLNALPYFYRWSREGGFTPLLKGAAISMAGAAAHHVTFLFGAILFALPVLWLCFLDRSGRFWRAPWHLERSFWLRPSLCCCPTSSRCGRTRSTSSRFRMVRVTTTYLAHTAE
jgi:uncharacterized membrane protein